MSAPIDDGGPAFPVPTEYQTTDYKGMSLRDWFAGQAMNAGLMPDAIGPKWSSSEDMAAWAYATADAMLAARKDQPK